ncbi:hypothetical protein Tco_0623022 [Tanacetum coccineum]
MSLGSCGIANLAILQLGKFSGGGGRGLTMVELGLQDKTGVANPKLIWRNIYRLSGAGPSTEVSFIPTSRVNDDDFIDDDVEYDVVHVLSSDSEDEDSD